jgi:hypothetical protein
MSDTLNQAIRSVTVAIYLPTMYLRVSIDLAGPRQLVDFIVSAVQPAVSRWPNSVMIKEH